MTFASNFDFFPLNRPLRAFQLLFFLRIPGMATVSSYSGSATTGCVIALAACGGRDLLLELPSISAVWLRPLAGGARRGVLEDVAAVGGSEPGRWVVLGVRAAVGELCAVRSRLAGGRRGEGVGKSKVASPARSEMISMAKGSTLTSSSS